MAREFGGYVEHLRGRLQMSTVEPLNLGRVCSGFLNGSFGEGWLVKMPLVS